jgi:hypothetical protein
MNTPNNIMKNSIVHNCKKRLKSINFADTGSFYWSPQTKTIHYDYAALDTPAGQWALLHETAHAQLGHLSYANDVGLLKLEVAAWQAAEDLASQLDLSIDPDHVQDCLNTYRDWLYARSTCPTCELNSLQVGETEYICLNCTTQWFVTQSRFCRPYRMQGRDKKIPPGLPQTVFA